MPTVYFLMVALNVSDGALEAAEVFDDTYVYELAECERQADNLTYLSEELGANQWFFCDPATTELN